MRYSKTSDGEWLRPPMRGYKIACCDCGLIHRLNFRVVDGRVELQAFRDNRATAQRRRKSVVVADSRSKYEDLSIA